MLIWLLSLGRKYLPKTDLAQFKANKTTIFLQSKVPKVFIKQLSKILWLTLVRKIPENDENPVNKYCPLIMAACFCVNLLSRVFYISWLISGNPLNN